MKNYIIIGAVGVGFAILFLQYVSTYNYGNRAEQGIIAAWEQNENVYATYGQKIREAAQVTTMQKDDVQDILSGAIEARYGGDGAQATFSWIQEQNPNVGPEVYIKIQQLIEAGRNEFKVAQTRLIDAKRQYRTELGYLWRGFMLGVAGYPTISVGYPHGSQDDYAAITTVEASNVFETGEESGPINLRPSN